MTSRLMSTIVGIFSFLNGIGALLMPARDLAPFGVETDAGGLLNIQYFGISAIGFAVVFWLIRNWSDWEYVRTIYYGGFVTFVLALILGVMGTLSGVMNTLGWANAAIDLLIIAGFAYFLFAKKTT
jgi:hypothetical protein